MSGEAEELVTLQHGTTLDRANAISAAGPDAHFLEPSGPPAGGFSAFRLDGELDHSLGTAADYANGKAIAFGEGGPAIIEVAVPKSIVDLAHQLGPEVRFEAGAGLEESRAAWQGLWKEVYQI
jgi:hypothetical protein